MTYIGDPIHPAVPNVYISTKRGRAPAQQIACSFPGCETAHKAQWPGQPRTLKQIIAYAQARGWAFDAAQEVFLCPDHAKGEAMATTPTIPQAGLGRARVEAFAGRVATWLRAGDDKTRTAKKELLADTLRGLNIGKVTDITLETQMDVLTQLLDTEPLPMDDPKASLPVMTTDQRRAIFREIDECYDRNAYVPGVTDKTIGEKLKLPWAFVKQVREDNFGPAGPSPEIISLKAEMAGLQERLGRLTSDIEAANRYADAIREGLKTLARKIAAIEESES